MSETPKPLDLDRDVVREPRLRAETSSQGGEFLPLDSSLGFCLLILFEKKINKNARNHWVLSLLFEVQCMNR